MAGEQRKCANCRYFRDAGMAKNGWCTHPKRQQSSDVKILVRAGELACRNSWGGDLFESRFDDHPQGDPAPELAASQQVPAASADDEVTSLITPPDRHTSPRESDEDRVVSDRPAPMREHDDDSYNDAARFDQDERARIMARGSRDALMRARERHSNRHGSGGVSAPEDDTGTTHPHDRVVAHQGRFSDRASDPVSGSAPRIDDAPVPRSEIRRRFAIPADRFDTVPEIDPSFDLPGMRVSSPDRAEPEAVDVEPEAPAETAEPARAEHHVEPYEHVLERARRIRLAKSQKAANPLRHSHLMARHQERLSMRQNRTVDTAPPREQAYVDDVDDQQIFDEGPLDPLDDAHERELPDDGYDEIDDLDGQPYHGVESQEDIPVHRSGRRSTGWLSQLGIRRRTTSSSHDDALVTRHADSWNDDRTWDQPAPLADETVLEWDGDEASHIHVDARWPEVLGDDRTGASAYEDELAEESELNDVVDDNTAFGTSAHGHLPDLIDDDVEHAVAAVTSRRPRAESWHRQRTTQQTLPDLDDNLFEETFTRARPSSPTDALGRAPIPVPVPAQREESGPRDEERSAVWPRESYFRASRFRSHDAEAGSPHEAAVDDARGPFGERSRRLPDLDSGTFDLREVVSRGGELLDMTIDVAPEIPRECRTCRSFRSADGGARGWCTNEWAFTHRRMVNEDDLACESTVGCWWLPADRYWLIEEQDGLATPTPRMDRLIAQRVSPDDKKISGA